MGNMSNFVKRVRDIMRNDAGINGDAQRIEQIAWMLFLKVYDAKEQDWEWDDENYMSIIPEPCRWRNWAHDEDGKGLTGDALLEFVNNTLFPVLKGNDIKDSSGNILIEGVKVTAETPIKKAIVQTTFADANNYMKLAVKYGIDPAVVYPHSFRHRFAKSFLERCNDIAFLADLMGHESIETTRIYLRKTATEQRALVDNIVDW